MSIDLNESYDDFEDDYDEDEDFETLEVSAGWAFPWRAMTPGSRWLWFEWLWLSVCVLEERYLLPLRSGWWRNDTSVETLAALAGWVASYDAGNLDDPSGKLGLLFDLSRIGELLREGLEPFSPERDRAEFIEFLFEIGAEPPGEDEDLSFAA